MSNYKSPSDTEINRNDTLSVLDEPLTIDEMEILNISRRLSNISIIGKTKNSSINNETKLINLNNIQNPLEWANNSNNIYIGRPNKNLPGIRGDWGNPYKITNYYDKEERKQCVDNYTTYITKNSTLMQSLGQLEGATLGCYCSPLKCHGEILIHLSRTQKYHREVMKELLKKNIPTEIVEDNIEGLRLYPDIFNLYCVWLESCK